MLGNCLRILNFDNSLTKQKTLLSRYKAEVADLTTLAPAARFWLDKATKNEIKKRLDSSRRNCITFLGSGDFHQVSNILINQFDEPICLIVFDFHPDWYVLPPALGCGSWLNATLKSKNILKCVSIGASSDDISNFWTQTGDLRSLKNKRLEIYPYSHRPSQVFFKKIYWDELKNKNLKDFITGVLNKLPSKNVYVSVDKDCLKREFAITNWEEGSLRLDELISMLKLIKENANIIGMDITGDYSKGCIKGVIKRFFSYLDHPKKVAADNLSEAAITAINEETNLKILQALFS